MKTSFPRKKGLSLIQKIQPVQTSKRSEANSSQMTNRTQVTKKNPLIQKKKGYSASICTELNKAQPVIYEKSYNHDISLVTSHINQNQFIELDLLNNSSIQQQYLMNNDLEQAIHSEIINCQESSQRLEETIEKSLSETQMKQIMPFSDEELESENVPDETINLSQYEEQVYEQNQPYGEEYDEQNFNEQDEDQFEVEIDNEEPEIQNLHEATYGSNPSFENFSSLPLEQLSKEQLLQIMHSIPYLLTNEINKVKQSNMTTHTNQTMTFESNPVPINNMQDDQQFVVTSQDNNSLKQELNMMMNNSPKINDSSVLNIETGNTITPNASYPRTPTCRDLDLPQIKKGKKAVTKRKGGVGISNKQIYQRIKQLNNEKYLLLRQLCIQKQIDDNLSSIQKERRETPDCSRYTSIKKSSKSNTKKFTSKGKSRNNKSNLKEFTSTETNSKYVRPCSKNWNRTQEDMKKIKKSKQLLNKQKNQFNKENEIIETEPQFSFNLESRNKEIEQLSNRYQSYLMNKDSRRRGSFQTSAFSSRKRSQRSQRSYSKSKRGSTSKNAFQPLTNRQLFEYGDLCADKIQKTNNDLSTKTTERKYNMQRTNTISYYHPQDVQNQQQKENYNSPSFKQRQSKCQCSFQEPQLPEPIPEYADENIRCEQNDWTDQENSTSEKRNIPTGQFREAQIELPNDDTKDYEDEPLHKRTHEDQESTLGQNLLQLNNIISDEDTHPLSSDQNQDFMKANYEHQQFLEYEDYVSKSQMFDEQVQLQSSNRKPLRKKSRSRSRKSSKENKKSRNGTINKNGSIQSQKMSRTSSINYKKDEEKIERYISDSLERKSRSRRSRSSKRRNGYPSDNEICLNQNEINVLYNGKHTWFGNQSANSITVQPQNVRKTKSKTGLTSSNLTRQGSFAQVKPTQKKSKKVKVKKGTKMREQSHRPSRQISMFSVPRFSNNTHMSADKKLNTQRFPIENRKWNPFFNKNKSSNYQDSFRDLSVNAIKSHRTNNESNGPIQRLIKFKMNTVKNGIIDLEQKWFLKRRPKDTTSDEYQSLPRTEHNNCFSEKAWRNDTKIVYSGNDTNSIENNSVRNQPIRKSEKIIKKISERLYNPHFKSQKHNQSMNLNTIQHLKSPPELQMNRKRNKSEDIQKRGRQYLLSQSRKQELEAYKQNKKERAQSQNSRKSRSMSKTRSGQVSFKARPFVNKQPFVVMKSTKKLTVPKGRQMMTKRMQNREQQMLLKKARQNRELSQSKSKKSQSSIGSGSKIKPFNPHCKTDDSRPMGYHSFDNEAFVEYHPKNLKQLEIENSIKKFDNLVNSFKNNEVSLNLNIEVQSKFIPDEDEQSQNKVKEKEYTKIGDYIQQMEGDMIQRSNKYLYTDLPCPCVPFTFGNNTSKSSIMCDESLQLDSIQASEKKFIRSNTNSRYHDEYQMIKVSDQEEPETTNDQTNTGPTSRRDMNPSMSYNNTQSHECSVIESVSEPNSSKKTTNSEKQEIELMKALRASCFQKLEKTQTQSFDLQEKNQGSFQKQMMYLTQGSEMKIKDFENKLHMIQSSNGNHSLSKSSSEKQYIDDGSSQTSSAKDQNEEAGDSTVRKLVESVHTQQQSFDSSKKPFEYKEVCPTDRGEDPSFKSIEKHKRISSIEIHMTDKTVFKSDIKTDRSNQTVVNTVVMSLNANIKHLQ